MQGKDSSENNILKKIDSNELRSFDIWKKHICSILTAIVFFQEASTWKGNFEGSSGNSKESNLDFMIQVVFLIILIWHSLIVSPKGHGKT